MRRCGPMVEAMACRCGVCLQEPAAVACWLARLTIFLAAGALPVLSISLHVLGVMSMQRSSVELVIPVVLLAAWLCLLRAPESVAVMQGALAGLAGVAAYDGLRLPFVIAGVWPDFIPAMGAWIYGGHGSNALLGYTWRIVGDGGGIAVGFALGCALLGWRRHLIATGLCYGIFVWSCLVATILLAPHGPELLFPLTAFNFAASLLGHLVYGSVAGWTYGALCRRAQRPPPPPESPEELIDDGLSLPDPNDRHVLAAAIRSGAQVIVTANLRDFPREHLASYSVEAQHPDEFALHLVDLAPGLACNVIAEQAAALRKPPRSIADEVPAAHRHADGGGAGVAQVGGGLRGG
jgi:hypothetical protein